MMDPHPAPINWKSITRDSPSPIHRIYTAFMNCIFIEEEVCVHHLSRSCINNYGIFNLFIFISVSLLLCSACLCAGFNPGIGAGVED